MKLRLFLFALVTALFTTTAAAQPGTFTSSSLAQDSRFFEMRTYRVAPGKMDALHARFRDHTNKIFANHGMQIVGFWVPMDKEGRYGNTLVYILAFASKDARDKAWKDFAADPEWQKVRAESEKDGRLVEKVDSQYMSATDYSPIK